MVVEISDRSEVLSGMERQEREERGKKREVCCWRCIDRDAGSAIQWPPAIPVPGWMPLDKQSACVTSLFHEHYRIKLNSEDQMNFHSTQGNSEY